MARVGSVLPGGRSSLGEGFPYCTVRFAIPVTPFTLAEIVVVPVVTPLASPRELTVATAGVDELHAT